MARLAGYMADFAELLGHQEHVHFEAAKPGSLSVASRVEPMAQNKVWRRVDEVRYGNGPKAAIKAYQSLDNRLAEVAVIEGEERRQVPPAVNRKDNKKPAAMQSPVPPLPRATANSYAPATPRAR